jgi:hypothetical protein
MPNSYTTSISNGSPATLTDAGHANHCLVDERMTYARGTVDYPGAGRSVTHPLGFHFDESRVSIA